MPTMGKAYVRNGVSVVVDKERPTWFANGLHGSDVEYVCAVNYLKALTVLEQRAPAHPDIDYNNGRITQRSVSRLPLLLLDACIATRPKAGTRLPAGTGSAGQSGVSPGIDTTSAASMARALLQYTADHTNYILRHTSPPVSWRLHVMVSDGASKRIGLKARAEGEAEVILKTTSHPGAFSPGTVAALINDILALHHASLPSTVLDALSMVHTDATSGAQATSLAQVALLVGRAGIVGEELDYDDNELGTDGS